MYENTFNSIERELRNEPGIANELDNVEQISVGAVPKTERSYPVGKPSRLAYNSIITGEVIE